MPLQKSASPWSHEAANRHAKARWFLSMACRQISKIAGAGPRGGAGVAVQPATTQAIAVRKASDSCDTM
jgi:hypothetical protein